LKVSIGTRLFLALVVSFFAITAVGVELVRWKLIDNFSAYPAIDELSDLAGLRAALSTSYQQHHDWSLVPADPAARRRWLREAWLQSLDDLSTASTPARSSADFSFSLPYRIGLLDSNGHYLAGAIASPWLIAMASIDTRRQALFVDGATVGYVVVSTSQNPDDALAVAFLIDQQENLLALAVVGVLLSVGVAALLAINFRWPIRQLLEGAQRLGGGQLDARLHLQRSDELGELAHTFNQLAAQLEAAERSRRQWVADTSHELRTPLSVLRGQLEALQDGIRSATPGNITLMLKQTDSLATLVDELYELARADVGQLRIAMTVADVWPLIQAEIDSFAVKFRGAGLAAIVGTPPVSTVVDCDPERIRQVVRNLLENCVRYTARGGRVEIDGAVLGHQLHIVIDDSAPGVPGGVHIRLGERFFRVESSRDRQFGGAGLGLALSRQIVEAHGGQLLFGPSPLGGLRVTIVLKLTGAS